MHVCHTFPKTRLRNKDFMLCLDGDMIIVRLTKEPTFKVRLRLGGEGSLEEEPSVHDMLSLSLLVSRVP